MSVDDDHIPSSWRHMIDPERWAREVHDTSGRYFTARVYAMDSEKHLSMALNEEVSRDQPREDRVATFNKRLQELREEDA